MYGILLYQSFRHLGQIYSLGKTQTGLKIGLPWGLRIKCLFLGGEPTNLITK